MGTTSYMSPEQLQGQSVGPPSDMFSMGVVLYEMTTGSRPFEGDTVPVICAAILNRAPIPPRERNHDISPGLEEVISRALEKDPNTRYQHASEMRAELQKVKLAAETGASWPRERQAGLLRKAFPAGGWMRRALVGVMAAALLSAIALVLRRHPSPAAIADKYPIVLADFSNSTGESIFDDALRQGLEVDLQQSPFLNIVSDSRIRQQLRYMGRPTDQRLTQEVALEVCKREGAKATLFSSIANLGSHYVVALKAQDCQTAEMLGEEQGEADSREKVLTLLHDLATRLRARLGESLTSVQKHDTPLEQATTSSLEALQAYSLASHTFRTQGEAPSLPLYQRAIELDPDFALAYASLSVVYSNLNEDDLSREYATKAYQLRNKVTEWERFSIDSIYYQSVTGELEKAAQVNSEWKETYPHELAPYVNLGLIDSYLGQLEKALSDDQDGLRVTPDTARIYSNLASDYLSLGRLDEAEKILQEAHRRQMDDSTLQVRYQLAFLRGDADAMTRLTTEATGKPGLEDALLASQADTEAFHGRLVRARDLSRQAVESALRAGAKETAATWRAGSALREAEFGNLTQARSDAISALSMASNKEVQIAAAIALSRAGDQLRVRNIVSTIKKRYPDDTLINHYWLPCIRAALAIGQNQAARAVAYLQQAAPYELGGGAPPFSNGATLYPAYFRGQAYLQQRQWALAQAEFNKIIGHPGLLWNFPLGALADLQSGRSFAGAGDTTQARVYYQKFLDAWRDADRDIPVYQSAKQEIIRLQ
jgi:eukaryotic-like serine/threonine-protein kinase